MSILGRRMLKFPHNYKVLKTSKCWMKFCLFAWHRSSCTSYTNSFVFMIVKPSKKWNKKAIPRCEILSECWAEFKWPQSVCFLLLGWLMQKLLYIISLVCLRDSFGTSRWLQNPPPSQFTNLLLIQCDQKVYKSCSKMISLEKW